MLPNIWARRYWKHIYFLNFIKMTSRTENQQLFRMKKVKTHHNEKKGVTTRAALADSGILVLCIGR
jgi:hypothetical protein